MKSEHTHHTHKHSIDKSDQNMFEFPPENEATPNNNTLNVDDYPSEEKKIGGDKSLKADVEERETFGAGSIPPQKVAASHINETQMEESNYTSEQFEASAIVKSSQGYT